MYLMSSQAQVSKGPFWKKKKEIEAETQEVRYLNIPSSQIELGPILVNIETSQIVHEKMAISIQLSKFLHN